MEGRGGDGGEGRRERGVKEVTPCLPDSPGSILKEAIVGTEHLPREEVKPLPCHAPIVQPMLPCKLDVETRVEVVHISYVGHYSEAVFKEVIATHRQLKEVGSIRLRG